MLKKKIRRVGRRIVELYEGDVLIGIEHRFSPIRFFLILLLSALMLAGVKFFGYDEALVDRISDLPVSDFIDSIPAEPYTVISGIVMLFMIPVSTALSYAKAYIYTGVNGHNTLVNIILDRKERFRDRRKEIGRLRKRKDRVVVEEYTDGERTFRVARYINGRKRKRLARRNEKLLAEEIELAMIKDCELFGERVAIMLDILKTSDVAKAEEEAHADYLMIALDAVVNFLREHDGATLDEMKRDKEISTLDYRYIKKALEYLASAPGGPYIKEVDGKLHLSKLLM